VNSFLRERIGADTIVICQNREWKNLKAILPQICPELLEKRIPGVQALRYTLKPNDTIGSKQDSFGALSRLTMKTRSLLSLARVPLSVLRLPGMPWIDETEFEKDPNIYDKIPSECGRLTSILAVAVRYGVVGLVKLVEERLRERLLPSRATIPPKKTSSKSTLWPSGSPLL
jgi:hypothetical protein